MLTKTKGGLEGWRHIDRALRSDPALDGARFSYGLHGSTAFHSKAAGPQFSYFFSYLSFFFHLNPRKLVTSLS